jgi:hypothetical protein
MNLSLRQGHLASEKLFVVYSGLTTDISVGQFILATALKFRYQKFQIKSRQSPFEFR